MKDKMINASFVIFAVAIVAICIARSVIQTKHPDWTQTQITIKMFIWDYEGE